MVMDAFGGWVFSLNEGFPKVYLVSQFCGYVVYSLACGFQVILSAYLFQIYCGLCGNGDIFCCKFPYKWYQSYGCVVVTLDWIHGNAWEDKRKGKIYEFFILDLRILGLLLKWNISRFWACEIFWQKGFSNVSFKSRF